MTSIPPTQIRLLGLVCGVLVACAGKHPNGDDGDAGIQVDAPDACPLSCSADLHTVVDCHNSLVTTCASTDACDGTSHSCVEACAGAATSHRATGCDYYATDTENIEPTYCFAAFVVNTWTSPAHISVEYDGASENVAAFTRLPAGVGLGISYTEYDPVAGLPPGEVAILFLAGDSGGTPNCPVTSAVPSAGHTGSGLFSSFHITTDVPVVAYEMNPYGDATVLEAAASLLLPTSVWDVNYLAVSPAPAAAGNPSLNIIARDDTVITFTPTVAVAGGGGIPAGAANVPMTFNLSRGQHAQITQPAELTGSVISSSAPIGLMLTHNCMNVPAGFSSCEHGEQMVPPQHALGNRYAGVMYRPRIAGETATFWKVVGTVDGTQLSYSTDVGGPATLNKGQAVNFLTGTPFVVQSQDADHPFEMFTYMTGSGYINDSYGDPDFVVSVPPEQYLSEYVFFADPNYPETNLVLIRERGADAQFHDVTLDCAGTLANWQHVGDYEWTRIDLVTEFAPVGMCSTGRHKIKSDAPFGLWVWGWGPATSYGYPGGMNVAPINTVVLQ